MDFLRETRWPPSMYNRRYHKRMTAVAMETMDQLSTYIYVYVDNHQNNIYDKEIMILFPLRIEYLPIYRNSSIRIWRLYTAIHRHSVIFTRSQSEAETKKYMQ